MTKSQDSNLNELKEKIRKLEEELKKLETTGMDEITAKRIASDIWDDYRENEGAKLVMEQHDIWYIQKVALKREIGNLRLQLIRMKKK